jgi:hypothetical protein
MSSETEKKTIADENDDNFWKDYLIVSYFNNSSYYYERQTFIALELNFLQCLFKLKYKQEKNEAKQELPYYFLTHLQCILHPDFLFGSY